MSFGANLPARTVKFVSRTEGAYPTLESFMPVVAQFYRSLAPRITERIASFDQHCAHVTGMKPFPNHSEDADPATREVVIAFDKSLDLEARPKASRLLH
jgi:hypothetical protein